MDPADRAAPFSRTDRGDRMDRRLAAAGSGQLGATTLVHLLFENAREVPNRVALREKDLGIWQEFTWQDYAQQVLEMAAGLEHLGFSQGDALIVMGDNRPHIYFGLLAPALLGGFPCPVYGDAIPDEVRYIAEEVGARFALAEDQEQVDKLLAALEGSQALPRSIVYDDPRGLRLYGDPRLISCSELQRLGREHLQAHPDFLESRLASASAEDVAVLLHSSGTTGAPKGVPLRHRHMLAAVCNAFQARYFEAGEEIMAYLPVAWVGDYAFSVAAAIALRFVVHIPERQETVLRDLREVGPTLYFAPPRSWDHMLTHVQVRMEESSRLKRALYGWAMRAGIREARRQLQAGSRPPSPSPLRRALREWLVYGPIKDHLGLSRVRRAYTAGEAIGEETFLFFRALGVNLKQFYGQTENCALTAAQADEDVRFRTVGRPLPGVEVRIDPETGEVLLRAQSLFDGYFRNPEATGRAFSDGWFRTGDAGEIDADGHLTILGRVEEVMATAGGTRFVPQYLENQLKFSPYVKEVAVLGAGREYLAAMVCIDPEAVGNWAESRGIAYTSYADLSQKPEVYALVREVIRTLNRELAEPLKIRRFVNLHKEFDPDDGELTRTRKLRRRVIEERYTSVIAALYDRQAARVEVAVTVVYEDGRTGTTRRTLPVWDVEPAPEAAHVVSS